eukprot:1780180-Rhodomonas_salina.2
MSKFRTDHTIPPEFPDILKDFVREILRSQPENIYQFGELYFSGKAGGGGGGGRGGSGLDEEALLDYLKKIFEVADENGDGILDRNEFKRLMQEADLGLSKSEVSVFCTCAWTVQKERNVCERKQQVLTQLCNMLLQGNLTPFISLARRSACCTETPTLTRAAAWRSRYLTRRACYACNVWS